MDRQPLEPLDERVLRGRRGHQDFAFSFTAWPPNWARSAALSLAANAFWPRLEKRSYSDVVSTGAGIRLSIASSTVQRPSPESST